MASRYRLLNEGDIKQLSGDELHVSTKIDGQLFFLYKDAKQQFLFNIKGRVVAELPLFDELASIECDQVLLAGELYCKNANDKRPRVYDVTSALGANSEDKTGQLCFAAFDILELDDKSCIGMSFVEKYQKLSGWFSSEGLLHTIVSEVTDAKGVSSRFTEAVIEQGEEGLVCVDELNKAVYKIKPRHNVDAVILGFTESPDTPDSLRVLLVGLMRPDNSFQVFAKVGTGFDDEQRREFFRTLKPMAVESQYHIADRNHTLFTMVRPEIVIEMAFHDVIMENASGRPEMKAVLSYTPEEGYITHMAEPFVSVLGPVFKRIRDDKEVNSTDLRLTQLAEFVDLTNLENSARSLDYAKSELLAREVYTKTTKGLVSVRKFISWKTNKDDVDDDYPAYVFCYVDFSPGRKDPLARVVRTASSKEGIEAVFGEYKESEVKRGWVAAE